MKYIDFYNKNLIIPTVNVKDLDQKVLFKQRTAFYHSVGINELNFENKTILELGPGTGYNAFYLLYSKIKNIVLVDLNDESIRICKENLKFFKKKCTIIKADIYKFKTRKKFDYVIIENVLANLNNPEKILTKADSFLKEKGHLILSTSDNFSFFADKLRGLLSKIIIDANSKIINKLEKRPLSKLRIRVNLLHYFFSSHFNKLGRDTRLISKWIQDNLLHVDTWINKKYLSLDRIIKNINKKGNNFVFWHSSPDFNTSFTWYKKRDAKVVNKNVVQNYIDKQINFLDTRENYITSNDLLVNKIRKNILDIGSLVFIFGKSKKTKKRILKRIIKNLKILNKNFFRIKKNSLTIKSIKSLITFLEDYVNYNRLDKKSLKNFECFWGNGTMQFSFLKYKK